MSQAAPTFESRPADTATPSHDTSGDRETVADTSADAIATVTRFVEANPMLALSAAAALGIGLAAALMPSRRQPSSLDTAHRELADYGRQLRRRVDREIRAAGGADMMSKLAGAVSSIDFKHVMEAMSSKAAGAVDEARKRLNA